MESKNVKLMNSGFSIALGQSKNNDSELDVKIMALCPGKYTDMNGTEVAVTAKTIHSLCDTYNEKIKTLFEEDQRLTPEIAELGIEAFDNRLGPNQLDHDDSTVLKTVGNVIGFMNVDEVNGKPYLFCTVRVKGEENVKPVRDKRWRNVSIQYHPETYEFAEISWVVKGAAPEARSLNLSKPSLAKDNKNLHLSTSFLDELATIQQTEKILLGKKQALEDELVIKKHLIALCVSGKINRATADYIEHEIKSKKLSNPNVLKLVEAVLPNNSFKPKYLNLLNKEEITKMSKEKTALSAHDFIANHVVALKKEPTKRLAEDPSDDNADLKYGKSHALKHKELMSKMAEAYEKGDVEMGKKYLASAHKLADACADGMANLSEYDIEEKSKGSDEVKKLSAELEATKVQLAALKDEQTIAFNKFKDDQMVVLGQLTESFNNSDVKQLLNKISTQEGVK